MTALQLGWQHPAAPDLATAVADGVTLALTEIGVPEPSLEVVEQTGEELSLEYAGTPVGPSAWAEQSAYALATGWDHTVPETAAERWQQVREAGEEALRQYVRYWAWLACHVNSSAFVPAVAPAYASLDDELARLVEDVLRFLLIGSTAPLPEALSVLRRLRDSDPDDLATGVLVEQLCAEHDSPIRLVGPRSVIAQIAADQRAVGGAFDYWLVERLGPLAELTPSTCFVVDDALPEGWLVVRHGRRPISIWPVPPAGCSLQSAPTPIRLHIPGSPDVDVYAAEGGTAIDYLADAVAISTQSWAAEMASTRQTERVLASLTSAWDALAVAQARELLGVELLTHALRRWLDAGHPVNSAQLLVREMLAYGHLPRDQALDAGFAAAVATLAGPTEFPLLPRQRVSDEVPTAQT